MKTSIAPDFRDLFRPLTESELEQATANNLADPDHDRIPPVVVWECRDQFFVVDGHHTLKIRQHLRIDGKPVKIRYQKMEFRNRESAMAYAIQAQLGRRNLAPSQIAIALAKLPKSKPGPKSQAELHAELLANLQVTPGREQLAEEAGVSRRTLATADKVQEHGAKSVIDAVAAGDVSVSDAASIVDRSKKEQSAAVTKVKSGKVKTLKDASAESPNSSIVLDSIDRPVPDKFREAHELSGAIQTQARKLDAILRELKSLAGQAGGAFLSRASLETDFKSLKGSIFGACYWSECPKCKGTGESCADCNNSGWWPQRKSGKLSSADKIWLGVD